MTAEIALVLGIVAASIVLFVTEWIRMDLVALLVLGVLALTGLVTPIEALAGFSNPAVVTVWAMFMLSAGLTQTGVAGIIGKRVLRLAGRGEVRMITVIMLTSAFLSAFMNNIGVAAMMLPVVMDIARQTRTPPSRLLMPLAYGCLLGGLTTLIGTPPNLLVSEALQNYGEAPFRLFDYSPVGLAVMISGILFIALVGRHMLPQRDPVRESSPADLAKEYALGERTAVIGVPADSLLVGKSLRDSKLGSAAGLNVFAITREGRTTPAPDPDTVLRGGDHLLVEGLLDRFTELQGWQELVLEQPVSRPEWLVSDEIQLLELLVTDSSSYAGRTLRRTRFRERFAGALVLALRREAVVMHADLAGTVLRAGDRLLVQGQRALIEEQRGAEFDAVDPLPEETLLRDYELGDRLFTLRLPADSMLAGKSLAESRIGDSFSLGVLGLERDDKVHFVPGADERLEAGDLLLVRGHRDSLEMLRGLQQLSIESEMVRELGEMESDDIGLTEAMIAPRSSLAGMTLRDIDFRGRYGLQVMAILQGGRTYRSNLRDRVLQFGDALLLLGKLDRRAHLARDADFILLTQEDQETPRRGLAPVATLIMTVALGTVLLGWLPISIAAVAGATLMILVGCLTMTEAYAAVEWRAIFLIAGMLPLGAALQNTGAASFLADRVLSAAGPFGVWGVLVSLYLLTAVATSIIPTAALVVLMAPIAMRACADIGLSPHAAMMAVAMAASASFTSPISHPANILVMAPGGYRFVDYVKVGLPLTLVVMLVALLVLPFFWPL